MQCETMNSTNFFIACFFSSYARKKGCYSASHGILILQLSNMLSLNQTIMNHAWSTCLTTWIEFTTPLHLGTLHKTLVIPPRFFISFRFVGFPPSFPPSCTSPPRWPHRFVLMGSANEVKITFRNMSVFTILWVPIIVCMYFSSPNSLKATPFGPRRSIQIERRSSHVLNWTRIQGHHPSHTMFPSLILHHATWYYMIYKAS